MARFGSTAAMLNCLIELTGLQLMDMAPTILEQFGVPVPADMQGKAF
jgi:bisphosphoglycerate-independent phosphoglycerate mutase (AlkP superfamily)